MSAEEASADLIAEIIDEFVAEIRMGQQPTVDEFVTRYPAYEVALRELLPTLAMMEKAKSPDEPDEWDEASPGDHSPMVGRHLGDYRIIRQIGRGGMGVVYEAEQISLGRLVALKVLPLQLLADGKQRTRFTREAKAAAKLHHTNIVPVFGVGEDEGIAYYVMQFIHGQGLDEVLDELRRIDPAALGNVMAEVVQDPNVSPQRALTKASDINSEVLIASPSRVSESGNSTESDSGFRLSTSRIWDASDSSSPGSSRRRTYWHSVARIGQQVAEALHYAHNQGVMHRDIKPSNLLMDLRGCVWITDFGLAKADDQQNLTHSGDILGTVRYMPPEAFSGDWDGRSDLYSLGITLYELLTLQPAFRESDRRQLIRKVIESDLVSVERVNPQVPADLATIVRKSVERDPQDRYQSGEELAEDLRRFLMDEPILARRAGSFERLVRWARQNKGLSAALSGIGLLLVILAASGFFSAIYFREQQQFQQRLLRQKVGLAERNAQLAEEKQDALYAARMVMAYEALKEHRGLARTIELLDACQPAAGQRDRRDWEWYFLNSLCHREDYALVGHRDRVLGVRWSPDGKWLASASHDGQFLLWNAQQRTLAHRFDTRMQEANCVVWHSNGKQLFAGGDGGVEVWDVLERQCIARLVPDRKVYGLAWSQGLRRLAVAFQVADSPGEVQVFDGDNWSSVARFTSVQIGAYTTTIDWNPSGVILALPVRNRVTVWGVHPAWVKAVPNPILSLEDHHRTVQAVAFDPSGRGRLATCSQDATIQLYRLGIEHTLVAAQPAGRLRGHTHGVATIAWHPTGEQLASAGWDGTARVWDPHSRRQLTNILAHPKHVFALDWSPSGEQLATGGDDNLVKVWTPRSYRDVERLSVCESDIVSLAANADSSLLCLADREGHLSLWDWKRRVRLASTTLNSRCRHVRFIDNDTVCASDSQWVARWDWQADQLRQTTLSDSRRTIALAMDRASSTLFVVDHHAIQQLEPRDLSLKQRIELAGPQIIGADWNPIKRLFALCDASGQLRLVSASGELIQTASAAESALEKPRWSHDGRRLAVTSADHVVRIYSLDQHRFTHVLQGQADHIPDLAWGPGDRRLVTTDARGNLRMWDTMSGQLTFSTATEGKFASVIHWPQDASEILINQRGRLLVWNAAGGYKHDAPSWHPNGSNP